MKKVFVLLLSLLFLTSATTYAEIDKLISANYVRLQNESRYKINGTDKSLWILFSRDGTSNNSFKSSKLQTNQELFMATFKDGSSTNVKTDMVFSTKTPPKFVFANSNSDKNPPFEITGFGTDSISLSIINKASLITTDKLSLILTLKDGTTETIEIPDDVLKDWKYILTCNLVEEYKKGI